MVKRVPKQIASQEGRGRRFMVGFYRMIFGWVAFVGFLLFALVLVGGIIYSVAMVRGHFNSPEKQMTYQEERDAVGIVQGQINELQMGEARLRIPPLSRAFTKLKRIYKPYAK